MFRLGRYLRMRRSAGQAVKTSTQRQRTVRLQLETLEVRLAPAVRFVDNAADFTVTTNNVGGPGPDIGDVVTWNPGAGSQHGGAQTGLIFGTDAFGSIQDAINAAGNGDTIRVAGGTFSELVTVNKSVSVLGNQVGNDARTRTGVPETTVNGAVIGLNRTSAFYITASNSSVDGFTVRDQNDNNQFGAGIVMSATTSEVEVRNNIITNNSIGLYPASSGASVIERNLIHANNTTVDGNGNATAAGGAGIYTDFATTDLIIRDNEFRDHTANNPIIFGATAAGTHTNLTFSNNFIHDNNFGVLALALNGALFQGNTISTTDPGGATALSIGDGSTGVDVLNNVLEGNARGLRIANFGFGFGAVSDVEAHFNSFANNSEFGLGVIDFGAGQSYASPTLDATCNWWGNVTGPTTGTNPGGTGAVLQVDGGNGVTDFQPWLLYGDADTAAVGFQVPISFTVTAQTSGFTSTNNNYRRLVNAMDCLQDGQTVILSGNFDWTEANAAASWALGNDGLTGTPATDADNFSLLVTPNVNNVTVTATSLGSAQISGPGDLAGANLEGVFVFDGGDNQGWTISNLEILDFDLSIGMFFGAGGVDAFNGTTISNNRIRVPADLNATAAPTDVNQNIGIHYSFGTNQTIANNQIELDASGVSNSGTGNFASVVGMQSNTSGGAVYDGLLINGNIITVTGAQAADPSSVLGIWENAHGHTSNITISNNQVLNQTTGGTPATNLIRAFRVTSHSSTTTTVAYTGNSVDGTSIGFQWLASTNFAGNQPVQLTGNTVTNSDTAVLVQSNGSVSLFGNTITGSGTAGVNVTSGSLATATQNFITGGTGDAIRLGAVGGVNGAIFNNDLSGNTGFGVNNLTGVLVDASGNWWGTSTAAGVAGEVNGPVDYTPWLDAGTDTSASAGFQGDFSTLHVDDTSPQVGAVGRIQEGIDAASGATPTVIIEAGTYAESVAANKSGLTLDGATGTATDVVIDPTAGNGITISTNNVTVRDLRVTSAVDGISASSVSAPTLINVQADTNSQRGVFLSTVTGTATLTDVVAQSNSGRGLLVSGGVNVDISNGSYSNNGSDGIALQNISGTATVTNVSVLNNTGLVADGLEAASITTLVISGGDFSGNSDEGIDLLLGIGTGTISGAGLTGNGDLGLAVGQSGGGNTALNLSDLTITGNTGGGGSINNVTTFNFTGSTGAVRDDITITGNSVQHTRDPLGGNVVNQTLLLANVPNVNAFGADGSDVLNVAPPPTGGLNIAIDGGPPSTLPGDRLNYDAQGETIISSTSPITATNLQPVSYTNIETLDIQNAAPTGLVVDGTNSADTLRLFVDPVLGPAYQLNGGPITALGGATAFTFNGLAGNDTMIVDLTNGDPIPAGNAIFNGGNQTGTPGDRLEVIGDGADVGFYNPSPTIPGDGTVQVVGKGTVVFTGLEPTTISGFLTYTFPTPNSDDVLTIDSPAAGRNRISGTSGGVAFEALTFFDVGTFILNTGANDGAVSADEVTLDASGLVATGLVNFIVSTGTGNDILSAQSTSYATPGSAAGFSFQGGGGADTFIGSADISYVLADGGVTSSAGGTINFTSVEQANLSGGVSNNTFTVSGWTQIATLDGGGGTGDQASATNNADFTLTDSLLTRSSGGVFTLVSIENASLTGGAGDNTFTISGWTQSASLSGLGGSGDKVVSSNNSDFSLSDTSLARTNGATGNFTLSSIEVAELTGGAAANVFSVSGWSGSATLGGAGAGDTYNVALQGFGAGSVAILDSGGTTGDTTDIDGTAGADVFAINPAEVTLGGESVSYTGDLEQVTVSGLGGEDTFSVTPSADTAFTIVGGDPTPPATPGDALDVDLGGTTGALLSATATPSGFSGQWTFTNRQSVTFSEIEKLPGGDLQVTKTDSVDPVLAGANLTYTITVTNAGPHDSHGVLLTDLLPTGTTFVSATQTSGPAFTLTTPPVGGTGTFTAAVGTLAAGATATFALVVNVNASTPDGAVITNTAGVTSTTVDSDTSNNSDTATTDVDTEADLVVTKTDSPDPVVAGTNLTYTITVTNNGPSDAQTVELADLIPTGTTFVSATQTSGPAFTLTTPPVGGTGTFTAEVATLAAGAAAMFTLVINVNPSTPDSAVVSNTAEVTSATTDPNTSNNTDTTTTDVDAEADVSVTKSDSPDPVLAGNNLTYTITVTNAGPSDAQNVVVTDTLPAGTTFVSATPSQGTASGAGTTATANLGTLAAGATATVTIVAAVASSVPDGTVVTNTVSVTSATADPNSANNSDTETTAVNAQADVSVTKTDSPDPVGAGNNITYTLTVTNNGPSDAQSVLLSDVIPIGTTFVSAQQNSGPSFTLTSPPVGGTGTFTADIATLAAGAAATFTLVVTVNTNAPDGSQISNTVTVTSTTTDPDPGNNTASLLTNVLNRSGAFFLDGTNRIWVFQSSSSSLTDTGGFALQISAGVDLVGNPQLYFTDGNNQLFRYNQGVFTNTGAFATRIQAGQGQVFFTDGNNQIWIYQDVGGFTQTPGFAKTLSVGRDKNGQDEVFFTDGNNQIWRFRQGQFFNTGGFALTLVAGWDGQIAFTDGFSQLWHFDDVNGFTPTTGFGTRLSAGLDAFGNDLFFALDSTNQLFRMQNGAATNTGAFGLSLAAGRDSLIAITDGNHQLVTSQGGAFTQTGTLASGLSLSRNGFGPLEGYFLNGPEAIDAVFQLYRFGELGLTPIGATAKKVAAF